MKGQALFLLKYHISALSIGKVTVCVCVCQAGDCVPLSIAHTHPTLAI